MSERQKARDTVHQPVVGGGRTCLNSDYEGRERGPRVILRSVPSPLIDRPHPRAKGRI